MEEDPKKEEEKRQQNHRQHRHVIGTAEAQKKPRKTASIDRRQGTQGQRKPDSITGQLFAKYILSE